MKKLHQSPFTFKSTSLRAHTYIHKGANVLPPPAYQSFTYSLKEFLTLSHAAINAVQKLYKIHVNMYSSALLVKVVYNLMPLDKETRVVCQTAT